MSVSPSHLLWQEQRRKKLSIRRRNQHFGCRVRAAANNTLLHMDNQTQAPGDSPWQNKGDSPWQSIRLALGALLLILGGLGLMLLDGNKHTSTARSSAAMAQSR